MIKREEFIGEWLNFEMMIESDDSAMQKVWEEAEASVNNNQALARMFAHGVRNFWRMACDTTKLEHSPRLKRAVVTLENKHYYLEVFDLEDKSLGKYAYELESIIEHGLEGQANAMYVASDTPLDYPYKYVMAMAPMPSRNTKNEGGLISHIHFQFASARELLVDENNNLRNPMWYPTVCDNDSTRLQKCNIVRALHKMPAWSEEDLVKITK